MKGDFTRSTFDHKKHYSSVRMQQGRVQLDAEWNEQADIQTYLLEQSLLDVVGPCGAPLQCAGFALNEVGGKLMIGAGHYYVNGTLCENENECNYLEQENIKDAKLPDVEGIYLLYLDVWQKHVTAVEDKSISEIALGGPDTTTRTKTIWQVKYIPISGTLDDNPCIQSFAEWDELIAERDAELKASVHHETDSTNPCIVPSGGGYRGLENHLYRVEIHRVDNGITTFKWSRDNGSILRAVDKIDSNVIKINNTGQDILHAFEPDQWIEITDEKRELNEEPGTLVHLTEVKDGVELKFDPVVIGDPVNLSNYPEEHNPKVRRWDQIKSGEIVIGSEWIELEHGLGVKFKTGNTYKSGDFWLIPARTADGNIEWSPENGGWHQPFGIEHQYCPLAIFPYNGVIWKKKKKDCRRIFPNMTEMVTLSYVGGDGQEAMPGNKLPAPLQVRVSVGQHPIKDARVEFSIIDGNGELQYDTKRSVRQIKILTGDDGIAKIDLKLDEEYDEDKTSIGVKASLLDAMLLNDKGESLGDGPSIYFQANVSIAKNVYYDPELCPDLDEKGINTVQVAIDELYKYRETEVTLSYAGGDGQEAMPGNVLPAPLQVRVSVGQHPIKNARVEFLITRVKGDLQPDTEPAVTILTGIDGIATIGLTLDEDDSSIKVVASLLDAMLLDYEGKSLGIPPSIYFQANASIAKNVYYDPELCPDLDEKNISTVQDAIDELCKYSEPEEPAIHIKEIYINRADMNQPLANDSKISVHDLTSGIRVMCDQTIDEETIEKRKPTCFVTLDLPYPFNSADMKLWGNQEYPVIGFQPLILEADLTLDDGVINWNPAENTKSWLESDLFRNMSKLQRGDRILAHLTLKGNFIRTKEDPYLYLDGEAYGVPEGENETNLTLPSGNGRRGGDFEMWFWLLK